MNECSAARLADRLSVFALAASLLAGCGPNISDRNSSGRNDAVSAAAPSDEVALTIVDRAGYDAAIAARRGQVVLVDFWATWCRPCVEQLPHTIELAERFGARGLAVVTVSCDEPAESERVAGFLRAKQASGVTNLISQYGGSPQTMEAFEIASGAVPYYTVYDRTGRLRHTFGISPAAKKQFSPQDIAAAVEQLLAE